MKIDRRKFLYISGSVAIAGIAGCLDNGGNDDGGNTSDSGGDQNGEDGGDGEGSADGDTNGGGEGGLSSWFSDVGNYDGVRDMTGQDEVTVTVGAQGNGGNYAFDPPAIRISESTTVVWRWAGEGEAHNVVAAEGAGVTLMQQDNTVGREDHTINYTFEAPGTYMYYCSPHRSRGMKGAVVVE